MRCTHRINYLLAITLLLILPLARAEPTLNGIAIHQELGREVFIGALFAEAPSNSSASLLASALPMRMELKVTSTEGISPRRFSRLWIEGMAVNNDSDLLAAQADNMVIFDGLFKDRVVPNDDIVFNSIPGTGVNISVNGVILGNIPDNKFFPMLLSTWIGRVPLSSEFREAILSGGDVKPALRDRFTSLAPSQARIAVINTWGQPVTEASSAKAADKTAEKTTSKANSSATTAFSTPALTIAKTDLAPPVLPTIAKPQLKLQVAETNPAPEINKDTVTATADTDDNDEPALTAQSLLARQFYLSDILTRITAKTRYPRTALERGQEGSTRLNLTIDRKGNILALAPLEESKYDSLNRAAREAIERAAPFPEVPEAIAGTTFEFAIPIRFALPK